jgi:hypothetical protein
MYNIPFWKDIRYENQAEHRIVFKLYDQNLHYSDEVIGVKNSFFDVDIQKHKNSLPIEFVY